MAGDNVADVDVVGTGAGQCVPFWGPFAAGIAPIGLFDANRSRAVIKTNQVAGIEQLLHTPILAMQRHIITGEVRTPVIGVRHIDEQVSTHHAHAHDSHVDTFVAGHPVASHSYQRDEHHFHHYGPIVRHTETALLGEVRQPFMQVHTVPVIENGITRHVHHQNVYSIFENGSKSLLGGVLGFLAIGPIVAGLGLLFNFRWDVQSHRLVLGRKTAYDALELDPPKYVGQIFNWQDKFTDISWSQQRGVKVIAGLYSGVGAGGAQDILGVWRHRIVRVLQPNPVTGNNDEIITITLSRQGRKRLEAIAGVFPLAGAKKTLKDASTLQEIQFSFKNIRNNPEMIRLLDELVQGHDKTSVLKAKQLADRYLHVANPPIIFASDRVVDDKRSRNFFRLRIPAIFRMQKSTISRFRKIEETVRVGNQDKKRFISIGEVLYRKEGQYPIESSARPEDRRIYPERVGINSNDHVEFPLDYRNSNYAEVTQVRTTAQGSAITPYQIVTARYQWLVDENYISRQDFINKLKKLGAETGLLPLLPGAGDIPLFTGPPLRAQDKHESMILNLEMLLSARDKNIVKQNIVSRSFEQNVISLLAGYKNHPNNNYLYLNSEKLDEILLRDECRKIVSKVNEFNDVMSTGKKPWFFGLFKRSVTDADVRVMEAELLHMLKVSPFIFLSALNGANPKTIIRMAGTSLEDFSRDIDVTLARDIMQNRASAPVFQPRPQIDGVPADVLAANPIKTIAPGPLGDELDGYLNVPDAAQQEVALVNAGSDQSIVSTGVRALQCSCYQAISAPVIGVSPSSSNQTMPETSRIRPGMGFAEFSQVYRHVMPEPISTRDCNAIPRAFVSQPMQPQMPITSGPTGNYPRGLGFSEFAAGESSRFRL